MNPSEFPVYKKRQGGQFNLVRHVLAYSFEEAKQIFAKQRHEEISESSAGEIFVESEGWYDSDKNDILLSVEEIENGTERYIDDVYTYELGQPYAEDKISDEL